MRSLDTSDHDELASKSLSIVVPSIGISPYLDQTLNALIDQSVPAAEILVLDNSEFQRIRVSSPLRTHPALTWRSSGHHLDPIDSWNLAVRSAIGDFVVIVGDDDIALPNFSSQIQAALKRTDFVVATCNFIAANGRIIRTNPNNIKEDILPQRLRWLRMNAKIPLFMPGVAFRKSSFMAVGGFVATPFANALYADDLLWFTLSTLSPSVAFTKEPCWHYRFHEDQLAAHVDINHFAKRTYAFGDQIRKTLEANGVAPDRIFPKDLPQRLYCERLVADRALHTFRKSSQRSAVYPLMLLDSLLDSVAHLLRSDLAVSTKASYLARLATHAVRHLSSAFLRGNRIARFLKR